MDDATRQQIHDNLVSWDALVPHHVRSAFYDVRGFVGGRDPLGPLAPAELGDVSGKKMLHLQCHFGIDSLAWARRGAEVTGLDFSPRAIEAATTLAEHLALEATFVVGDVLEATAVVPAGAFDVVYTSWGVLMWLPDLDRWAAQVAALLRPGGVFYLLEVHPFAWMFVDDEDDAAVSDRPVAPYFGHGAALSREVDGSYAIPDLEVDARIQHLWRHELGQVVTALVKAGLLLEFLHEHDAADIQIMPDLVQRDDGMWVLPEGRPSMPLSFSLRARRPE
jgi:SAM-dependent methyltransferase